MKRCYNAEQQAINAPRQTTFVLAMCLLIRQTETLQRCTLVGSLHGAWLQ